MKNITRRNYQILRDHMRIYDFMTDIYERDWRNGVPAPFLEYALSSSWMDKSYTHRNMIWEDNGQIVAFCFYESPVTDIYFSLRPGYEDLADEMAEYADQYMPYKEAAVKFVLLEGQHAIIDAAVKLGYTKTYSSTDAVFDYSKTLSYPLPEGFTFTDAGKLSIKKMIECCWKGFDHEAEEGPWDGDSESGYHVVQAPHATFEHALAIENEKGDYVCFCGMWWTPKNKLAYMEPLCTIPEYRKRGLAAAALSEMYRRMKPLGATHMTGGNHPFYIRIGYEPCVPWVHFKR